MNPIFLTLEEVLEIHGHQIASLRPMNPKANRKDAKFAKDIGNSA